MAKRRRFPGRAMAVYVHRHRERIFASVQVLGNGFNPFRKYHVTPASLARLKQLASRLDDAGKNGTEPCAYVRSSHHPVTIYWRPYE